MKANRFPFKNTFGEFPGGPVVRTPCFHCWAWAVSLLGEIRSHTSYSAAKDNNKTTDVAAVFSLKECLLAWMGGEFGEEWIHVYIYIAELVWCVPETITMLLIGYTPIQKKKFYKRTVC